MHLVLAMPFRTGLVGLGLAVAIAIATATAPAGAETRAPQATPSPTLPPRPTLSPEELAAAQRRVAAATLLERIEQQRLVAESERAFLRERRDALAVEREATLSNIAELERRIAEREEQYRRVMQSAYRQSQESAFTVFLRTGSVVEAIVRAEGFAALGKHERSLIAQLRALRAEALTAREALARQDADLAALAATIERKEATLATLSSRAQALAAGRGSTGEIAVIRALLDDAIRSSEEADRILAEVARSSGTSVARPTTWTWPLRGAVTQEFGPSALVLEPPRTWRGVAYPHFHDGVDIGAALGAPVLAAARGRVAFVGRLPDGALVLVLAHDGGLLSLYGHLDDVFAPPPVRVGQTVEAGQRIGAVGMTGITTGPHLHFVVRRGAEVVDPRSLLPPRP